MFLKPWRGEIYRRCIGGLRRLSRIAEGLAIPRGLMGLAYAAEQYRPPTPEEEDMKRRAFISLVSSLALGGNVTEEQRQRFTPTMDLEVEPFRATVRESDAKALTAIVDAFRSTDQRFGGYGQYQGVLAAVRYGESLVEGADDKARRAILSGTAYCHASAGWFAMEEAHVDTARHHYAKALDFTKEARDPLMRARVLYCAGRTELHFGDPNHALKLFQLGTVGVHRSPLMMSVLLANSAWASAEMGCPEHALRLIEQAREVHDSVDFSRDTPMFGWFRQSDLTGVAGAVHLARQDYESALTDLETAIQYRSPDHHRSLSFDTSNLAHAHVMLGDKEQAVSVGQRVLEHASRVRSARLSDRMTPLWSAVTQRAENRCVRGDSRVEALRQSTKDGDLWQLSMSYGGRLSPLARRLKASSGPSWLSSTARASA